MHIDRVGSLVGMIRTCIHRFMMTIRSLRARTFGLIFALIWFVYSFRYTLLILTYIGQTYITWHWRTLALINSNDHFDTTMSKYPFNQTSAGPNFTDIVPPILHHIAVGNIDLSQRPTWITAREACIRWHPNYQHFFWNDSSAEQLITKEYPWFLSIWKSYPYPIQRADSLRYLVLYHYGGIFLDMDLHCRRSLGPLRRFEFVAPAAYPVGVSNGFMMTSVRHPFVKVLVDSLPLFNRNFLLPYATVMFSTGCMYLSAQHSLYNDRCRLRTLDNKQHGLSGQSSTPLFFHHGSSSWHSGDAKFVQHADWILKILVYHSSWLFGILCILLIGFCCLSIRKRYRTIEQKQIHEDKELLLEPPLDVFIDHKSLLLNEERTN